MVSLAVLAVVLGACDEQTKKDPLDVEACEHLREASGTAVTAATDGAGAPAVAPGHERYDVTLADVTGGKGGFLAFPVDAAGDHVIFMNAEVPLVVRDGAGQAVEPEESAASSTACPEIRARHLFHLEVGDHLIELGPTTGDSVSLILEEAGGHDHD
jgi:hypothetical protein